MVHIGQLIQEELLRQERTPSWLARKIHCDRTNIYKIFQRESIDTSQLAHICTALNRNFFNDLSADIEAIKLMQKATCEKSATQPRPNVTVIFLILL